MKKVIFVLVAIFLFSLSSGFSIVRGQGDDSLYVAYFHKDIEIIDPNYKRNYNYLLRRVKKVYPYAVYAKQLLDEYEADVSGIEKKRKVKKYGKKAHQQLMDDFEYVIRNMYVSEGKVLMKLVHRETGHTVFDIIAKYRGKLKASWYSTMGKMFEQNLKATYHPDKEDWLMERIVKEIEQGKHKPGELDLLTKKEFKEIKKEDKERSKKLKEDLKQRKKEKKEREKEAAKNEKN